MSSQVTGISVDEFDAEKSEASRKVINPHSCTIILRVTQSVEVGHMRAHRVVARCRKPSLEIMNHVDFLFILAMTEMQERRLRVDDDQQ